MATLSCPSCSNLLVISAESRLNEWACNTCPYEFPIAKLMTSRTGLARKQEDDVLGGGEMWKHADSIAGERFNVPPMVHDPRLDPFRGLWVREPSVTRIY
jgi:DNA-directed RNA polymerase subunit M/transcription elongation factor TFIIS